MILECDFCSRVMAMNVLCIDLLRKEWQPDWTHVDHHQLDPLYHYHMKSYTPMLCSFLRLYRHSVILKSAILMYMYLILNGKGLQLSMVY